MRSVEILGHIISSEGVEVDPKRIDVMKNLPRPLATMDIRSFLGLDGYNKRFVSGFAYLAFPGQP